jgi:uncharacterized protein YfaS (alpha-2-macroglobulin family)
MRTFRTVRGLLSTLLIVAFAFVLRRYVHAERATQAALGGPQRYVTAISTDKPLYRPGEKLWVRGVLLQAFDHTALREGTSATIEIKGPKGETVASGAAAAQDSVWAFGWQIPEGQAGGEYTIRATYPWNGHAPAERKFDVRVYRAPRLKSQIVFMRDGYGPGDKVSATLEVTRAEGGAPAGAKVTATARVDGVEVARVPATVSERGLCTVSFDLPKAIARGEGALSFAIEDGGVVETAAKTIPILLQTLDLSLHPEGGDLVAGVASRIYFEARTPAQKPADIAGVVVDGKGAVVARFRSEHEGRGRFDIIPEAGGRYTLRVEQPSGIKTTWPLPAPAAAGVAIRSIKDVVAAGAPLRLVVTSASGQKVKVTLSQREVELASTATVLKAGAPVELSLSPGNAEGVLTATVWSEKGAPVAERLVFRAPAHGLKIELRTDKKGYVPGDTVKLTARATRDGKPVAAVIGLHVTDDAVLEMIEKREQAPSLPVMVLLEPEVRELADAHVYFDEKNPRAPMAVDLLLGTQGWRRFAVMNVATLIERYGDAARRALALRFRARVEEERAVALAEGGGPAGPVAVRRAGVPRAVPVMAAAEAPMPPAPAPAAAPPPAPPRDKAPAPVVANEPAAIAVASQAAGRADGELDRAIAKEEMARDDRAVLGKKARLAIQPVHQDFVVVREYAHQLRPGRKPNDRVDFTETLFWNAAVRTDGKSGEVTVHFALNDSVTSFKAFANGFDGQGALGTASATVESVQPFYVEPKLPLEVTAGDVIKLPVSLVNGTGEALRGAAVKATASRGLQLPALPKLDLSARERARQILAITVGSAAGAADLKLEGRAGPYADTVTRKLAIKPSGFPFRLSFGGLTVKGGAVAHVVEIPAGVVAGSLRTSVAVYPTPLANMTQALARLIQDPYGCFEQTSSTTYPLTMAQQYFTSHTGVDPKLVSAAQEKLEAGYKRLVSFECSDKGYEWFGENPGHEALTAYGLLHFTDMAQVREVDHQMITRSRDWLYKQRDGKGGFSRKRRALHTWLEDRDASNGYILWAMLESGAKGLDQEIAAFKSAAAESANSYVTALGANVLALAGQRADAKKLMEKLAAKQGKAGFVDGATTSIVGSGGEALAIETTALAVLAWLHDPAFAGSIERSMKYLADSCQDGRYGSTQSTVLALRAIVAYDRAHARPKAPGSVRVLVDGQPVGGPVPFDRTTQGTIKLPEIAERLGAGKHRIEVKMEGGAPMPYSMGVEYSALRPDSAKECKVGIDVKLTRPTIAEGELVEAYATITNRSKQPVPTPVAIVGLPGGLEPRHDQLKELVKKGTIDAYEVIGRDVVLYWRGLDGAQQVSVPLSLVAAVPGTYTGPASRAYLYYTDEHKTWVGGLKATITPSAR